MQASSWQSAVDTQDAHPIIGASWTHLAPPTDVAATRCNASSPDLCALHLESTLNDPFATSDAAIGATTGVIIKHASIGPSRKRLDNVDLFQSRDAGLTWSKLLDGRYVFAASAHANSLVAMASNRTNTVLYSNDLGKTWCDSAFTANMSMS